MGTWPGQVQTQPTHLVQTDWCLKLDDGCVYQGKQMYCVYRENVYNRLHFNVYAEKWGLLERAEPRVGGRRTPAFLSPSYYSERQKMLGG